MRRLDDRDIFWLILLMVLLANAAQRDLGAYCNPNLPWWFAKVYYGSRFVVEYSLALAVFWMWIWPCTEG